MELSTSWGVICEKTLKYVLPYSTTWSMVTHLPIKQQALTNLMSAVPLTSFHFIEKPLILCRSAEMSGISRLNSPSTFRPRFCHCVSSSQRSALCVSTTGQRLCNSKLHHCDEPMYDHESGDF